MQENERGQSFAQFDIKEFLTYVFHLKFVIIAIVCTALVVSFIYTKFFCTPSYTAIAKVHILDNESAQQSTSEYSISTYLTRDYTILVTERVVLDKVIERLDLKMSYQGLKGCISTNNPVNSRIIEVSVTTSDPKNSMQIANSVCAVSQEVMYDLLGSDRVNIVSAAEKPLRPSSPNLRTNLIWGFMAGVALSFIIVVFYHYRNDKINGADDVQKYLEMCTLATIPYNPKNLKSDTKRRKVKS